MNREERRRYNNMKQKEYRAKKRGHPARHYLKSKEIFGSEGHCVSCGMRVDATFHVLHPCKPI